LSHAQLGPVEPDITHTLALCAEATKTAIVFRRTIGTTRGHIW